MLYVCKALLSVQGNLAENKTDWASQVELVVKNPPANEENSRDAGLIPGLGRSPRGGNGNPL